MNRKVSPSETTSTIPVSWIGCPGSCIGTNPRYLRLHLLEIRPATMRLPRYPLPRQSLTGSRYSRCSRWLLTSQNLKRFCVFDAMVSKWFQKWETKPDHPNSRPAKEVTRILGRYCLRMRPISSQTLTTRTVRVRCVIVAYSGKGLGLA